MRHENRTNVGILTDAQAALLASITREFSTAISEADVAELLTKATNVLNADVLAFVNQDSKWLRYGDHAQRPTLTGDAISAFPVVELEPGASTAHINGEPWTILRASDQHRAAVILIEGDWTQSAGVLMPLAAGLGRTIGVGSITPADQPWPALDESQHIGRSIYRMLRRDRKSVV